MKRKLSQVAYSATLRNGQLSPSTSVKKSKALLPPEIILQQRVGGNIHYLSGTSWYILVRKWRCSDRDSFGREWDLHPIRRHTLKLFGREVQEKRWSQSWGVSYAYSGSVNEARELKDSIMVQSLIDAANEVVEGIYRYRYNGCLENWYTTDDTIGLHADDEKILVSEMPIFSLSWGGTRRFLFRDKSKASNVTEIFLNDGDLLIMGGTTQVTHKHEVPKVRKTKDPPTKNRINWTIRSFRTEEMI